MKKRILAVLSAVAMCLSAISVTVNAEEIIPPDCAEETAKNENILTVSVVDYDTGELILTENDVVWQITLQAGFSVEYVLTDGTFAWGTAWADLETWSYGQLNPCEIDTSLYSTGFGVEDFQVVDMYIPKDYFLPEDYLEINYKESDEYHTDFPTDITVKLKKTIMGDVNDDGSFNVSDVVLLQKWLLAVSDTHLANWKAVDFCEDDRLDVFDLCLMKRKLIEQNTAGTPDNMPVIMDYHDEVTDAERENLWMMLSGKYPDMDFSDFTFVYDPDHPLSDSYNGKLFSIYYKNILLHGYGNINWNASVFAIGGGNDTVNFVVDPKLFTQVDLEQEIVPPLEVIPTCIDVETPELILYVDVMGENPPRLSYRAVDVRHDGEYILDAVTGESIEYIPYYVI